MTNCFIVINMKRFDKLTEFLEKYIKSDIRRIRQPQQSVTFKINGTSVSNLVEKDRSGLASALGLADRPSADPGAKSGEMSRVGGDEAVAPGPTAPSPLLCGTPSGCC